jgi:spermidine/putrescine transport system ATP-binding protein
MVLEPDVLLLDEPLGALDLKLREHMKIELKSLQAEFNTTFVYITHDQSEALVMSDNIAVMNKGRFDQIGTAKELYYEPANAFVAGFVGDANRFDGKVTGIDGATVSLETKGGRTLYGQVNSNRPQIGQYAQIFVRPEAIALSKDPFDAASHPNAQGHVVENVLFNGADSLVILRDPKSNETVKVTLPQTGAFLGLAKGDAVHRSWDPAQARCFVTEAP